MGLLRSVVLQRLLFCKAFTAHTNIHSYRTFSVYAENKLIQKAIQAATENLNCFAKTNL